jgi:hypothetical protein
LSKSSIEGGSGSGGGVLAGEAVEEGFTGGAAELDTAATVDECDESTDVAMSSSLEVAASSLRYIPVSLDIGAAIDLSMVVYARRRDQCFVGKYLLIRVVRLCMFVFVVMVAACLVRTREGTVFRNSADTQGQRS